MSVELVQFGSSTRLSEALAGALLLLFVGAGCVTRHAAIMPGEAHSLPPGHGYLLLDIDADVQIESIALSRGRRVLHPDRPHYLVALPSGDYAWHHIDGRPHGDDVDPRVRYFLRTIGDDEYFRFSVHAGQVNYPGQLRIRGTDGGFGPIYVRLLNQSAISLAKVRDPYREILSRHPITYSGHQRDDFLADYGAALTDGSRWDSSSKASSGRSEEGTRSKLPPDGPFP